MKKEILLSYFPKITFKRYQQLLAAFSNLDTVWSARFDELKRLRWDDQLISEFLDWRKNIDEEKIQKILEQEEIICLIQDDPEYPKLLKQIYDPPLCLFVRGKLSNDDFNLAVVGTRKCTTYGKQVTEEIVLELASQGITIVSGLAFGIDSIAHNTTLRAKGKTIAVLGSGIDRHHIHPTSHRELANNIINSGGAIISEYPPGTLPTKYTFPKRNRIVAGMSLGTLVIEAPEKSGALITAQCALDNNREVFTIPQNITSLTATGPNKLIQTGATCVTTTKDILDVLNLQDAHKYVTNKEILPDSPMEAELLKHLSRQSIHVDELIQKTHIKSQDINATLTLMEMKGKVKNLGNMNYVLSR
ncbi:DNA-protecting protein DprA [Candidatus Parcubacteria bacterium]|nr:MAG: DNA-protecting protein DprA [Candidatus Parcubacteria bacterium]